MPIYEYACRKCENHFDRFWHSVREAEEAAKEGKAIVCPACESADTRRVVSQVAVLGELGGLTPSEQSAASAQADKLASITPKAEIQQLQANRQKKREQGK